MNDQRTKRWDDPILQKMYAEERTKLTILPDADADFEALDIALKRYGNYSVEEGDNQ
ncbi:MULTISPECIES: hypothetical protein [Paenibacillus]|uniref:hypothetical protein n=1 Tax=Paenibacillus TaxID=44249 RepID=UPI0004B72459|nr:MULTISPECIES: hypothetical protein [Paenibacillus]